MSEHWEEDSILEESQDKVFGNLDKRENQERAKVTIKIFKVEGTKFL